MHITRRQALARLAVLGLAGPAAALLGPREAAAQWPPVWFWDTAFRPAQLPGLQLWLRADRGLYQDSARTTLAVADADPVGGWVDQSGRGNHASQATAGKRPTLRVGVLNGQPVLRSDGVDDFISLTGISVALGNYTITVVYNPTTAAGNSQTIVDTQTGRLFLFHLSAFTAGKLGWFDGTTREIADAATGAQVLTYRLQPIGAAVFRNGTSLGTANFTQTALGGNTALWANNTGAASFLAADLAELTIYNRALTTTERQRLERYYGAKYGIAVR